MDTHTPVLTEEADLFIDHGGQMNFLIEGDNLAALKLLEKTHHGKIDLIYIDPPYNRGIFNHAAPKVFLPNIGSLKERNLNERGIIENICDNCFVCIHSQTPC